MNIRKVLTSVLVGTLVASMMSISAFAVYSNNDVYDSEGNPDPSDIINTNGGSVTSTLFTRATSSNMKLTVDQVAPGSTFYVPLTDDNLEQVQTSTTGRYADISVVADDDYFKFSVDKDTNSKMIKSITVYSDKKLGTNSDRGVFLKVELNDSTTTDEIKSSGTITFKAKNVATAYSTKISGTNTFLKDDTITIDYNFWINNFKVTNDDNPNAGDRVYFDPDKNDTNTLVWGDDRAAIQFDSDTAADAFYARLSTKTDQEIYTTYGDPVNAELWFYDFVGSSKIPSTSRATVTLGLPWDEDDAYIPDVENVFIYAKDADGTLTDITSEFVYSDDAYEIPGWSTKTRVLGCYIVSDTELAIEDEIVDEDLPAENVPEEDVTPGGTTDGGKDLPNTGSNDMVGLATAAAVVSLAAAGAVAFRKASK